jgi:2-polyprenyl-3-methyl-5-hydroxy-6-metoxy-1,4-benzoquinol methylase
VRKDTIGVEIEMNSDQNAGVESGTAAGKQCIACGATDPKFFLEAADRFYRRPQLYRLLRCSRCSHVWLDDPPAPAEMGQHYGTDYDRVITIGGENSQQRWRDRRDAIYEHKTAGAILDIGCSSGAFLESMRGPDWQLSGIEMSADTAKRAAARSGGQIFAGDIMDAPFRPQSFDVITCFDVLEHVYEPRKVLAKVSEWLKPGGIYYVLVPNIDSGEARAFKTYWYGLELPRHLSHFSPESLGRLAKSVKLAVASLEARPNSAFGHSTRYIVDDLLSSIGIARRPMATAKDPSFPRKAVRKIFRMIFVPVIYKSFSLLGAGESIHAVFKKPNGHAGKGEGNS